jgi:uncharacterized protein YciI
MFVVNLHYIAPMEEVDKSLTEHVAFLNDNYAKGIFVASGRKVPRTGGVILARNVSRNELEAILDQDPFKARNLATYDITEFIATMTSPELAAIRESL